MRDYLRNGEYRLSRALVKLDEQIPEPNRSYALKYKDFLELNNRKARTIERRLSELRYVLRLLGKDAREATKEDIENVVRGINRGKVHDSDGKETAQDLAVISKGKLKLTLKNFIRWFHGSDVYPDIVKWVKIDRQGTNKLPEEMLTEEDIKKLIEACKNQRDKTIIALMWDTGMRVGELLSLKMKDISLNENVSYVMVSGKTGDRRVPLVFSVPYLANHINNLRSKARAEDALFTVMEHNTSGDTPIDYPHIRKLLGDIKQRAKLQKRVYPHLFRHSRATYYANSLTEQQAKMFFGWSGGSTMVAKYTHLSGRDIDNAVLKANGIENRVYKSIQTPSVKKCVKCHEINEITSKYCLRCGTPLDLNEIRQIENSDQIRKELDSLKNAINLLMTKLDRETQEKIMNVIK
ncbi:MAG: tyrosine-type recombinase/integrase [Candidatus Micrarchaeota archaeon]|nr:tyrosine-type recombinase/integrase [Candidatus Micrarchaeota archaeon]